MAAGGGEKAAVVENEKRVGVKVAIIEK